MNANIAELWASTLESNKYKQGKGRLKRGETFCCLGVLCDIYIQETKQGEWDYSKFYISDDTFNYLELPVNVMQWSGVKTPNGFLSSAKDDTFNSLIRLNDRSISFQEIAKIIRENREQL